MTLSIVSYRQTQFFFYKKNVFRLTLKFVAFFSYFVSLSISGPGGAAMSKSQLMDEMNHKHESLSHFLAICAICLEWLSANGKRWKRGWLFFKRWRAARGGGLSLLLLLTQPAADWARVVIGQCTYNQHTKHTQLLAQLLTEENNRQYRGEREEYGTHGGPIVLVPFVTGSSIRRRSGVFLPIFWSFNR